MPMDRTITRANEFSSYDKLFGITKVYEPLKIEEGDGKNITGGLDGKYFYRLCWIYLYLYVFCCI